MKLVTEGKQSAPEASKSPGIGESTLYKWIEQLKPMDEKDSKGIKVNNELIRLRGEVVELKRALAEAHREILKKAAAYFAAQTLWSMLGLKRSITSTPSMSMRCAGRNAKRVLRVDK